jgi:hypothetical protein
VRILSSDLDDYNDDSDEDFRTPRARPVPSKIKMLEFHLQMFLSCHFQGHPHLLTLEGLKYVIAWKALH